MPNILYIITQADGGGAQNYVLALAKHFNGTIAAGTESGKLFEESKKLGIKTHPLQHLKRNIHPYHDVLAIIELIKLIKNENPDIVHLNSSKAGFLGSLVKPFVKSKIIFTAHGFVFSEPHSNLVKTFYLLMEKIASQFRDYIITVSDFDRRIALQNNLTSENKIRTVHNGLAPFTVLERDEARAQMKIPQHVFTYGTLANLYKTKGVDVLIKAVANLPTEIRDKSLFLVFGNGPEASNLKSLISNLNLSGTVKLMGNMPNARSYLKALDVFVLPSRKEGFPYSLLEAMQAGLPIVTTRAGGNPEAVGEAAIIVEPDSSSDLAKALQHVFVNRTLIPLLTEKSLAQSRNFTLEGMLEETERIYNKILVNKGNNQRIF